MAGCYDHAGKAPRIGRRVAARRAASGAPWRVDAALAGRRCCEWVARYGGAMAPQGPQDPHLRVQLAQVGAGGEDCARIGPGSARCADFGRSYDVACMHAWTPRVGAMWGAVGTAVKYLRKWTLELSVLLWSYISLFPPQTSRRRSLRSSNSSLPATLARARESYTERKSAPLGSPPEAVFRGGRFCV